MLPLVALIGRTNVGKSTLFNRLIRQKKAIVHDLPGVTRDKIYGEVLYTEKPFALIDTGGIEFNVKDDISKAVFYQAEEAIKEADLILFVVDGKAGLTPLDQELADYLRKSQKPVHLVINKIDGAEQIAKFASDFHSLGFDFSCVSALYGFGYKDLLTKICDLLPDVPEKSSDKGTEGLKIALIGRPNVGKSSMINAFLGQKRLIVTDIPGTTRDSIDVVVEIDGKNYIFVDTAGIRRKSRIKDILERFSVIRAIRTSKRANVSILVMDVTSGLTSQDKKLLGLLIKEKVPTIVAVNKIDLIDPTKRENLRTYYENGLKFCSYVPIVFTSTITKEGMDSLLPLSEKLWKEYNKRISTGELNRVLQKAIREHQPPSMRSKGVKFYYLTQAEIAPPTFVFFMNDPDLLKQDYVRYLEKTIRRHLGFRNTPIHLVFRKRDEKNIKKEW